MLLEVGGVDLEFLEHISQLSHTSQLFPRHQLQISAINKNLLTSFSSLKYLWVYVVDADKDENSLFVILVPTCILVLLYEKKLIIFSNNTTLINKLK